MSIFPPNLGIQDDDTDEHQHQLSQDEVSWNYFFSENFGVSISDDDTSTASAVGDKAANTTTRFNVYLTPPRTNKSPLFIFHHGAGSCGLSFALVAARIRALMGPNKDEAGILTFDCRGHGDTVTTTIDDKRQVEAKDLDLSLQRLGDDAIAVINRVLERGWAEGGNLSQLGTEAARNKRPPLVFVGHSLGGAVLTDVSKRSKDKGRLQHMECLAVLDVVEGTALDALKNMNRYLLTRPLGFDSIPQAIEWHIKSRLVRRRDAAMIAVPKLLYDTEPEQESSNNNNSNNEDQPDDRPSLDSIAEDDSSASDSENGRKSRQLSPGAQLAAKLGDRLKHKYRQTKLYRYKWVIDLKATEPYWSGWFVGLSKKFLTSPTAKLLLLAGTDRLDKELTIGQMQGKFQLSLIPEAGHFLHEDCPDKTAQILVDFWRRNDRTNFVLPPKMTSS